MTDLQAPRAIEHPEPDESPRLTGPGHPQPVDPPSVFADGVDLTRLVARAQLSVAQAVELAAAVASEAVRRSGPDECTPAGGRAPIGAVLVGADGRVVPGPSGDGAAAGPDVAALLSGIADAVRPRAGAAGPAAEHLLTGLDDALAELADAGVPAVARTLREVAGAIDRRAVRLEIGALVRALLAEPSAAVDPPPAGAGWTPARAAPVRPAGRARIVRRRAGAWLLSVLVLAGVVLLEVGFLRGRILSDIGVLLDAGRGGATPTASAARTPDGLPVVAPAPASAGPVAGVDLRALMPCTPGTPCSVRVEVRLAPAAGQRVVTWSYRLVDRCTGASATAPGGTVTLPAGAPRATVVGTVALPAAPGVALIAVTRQPAAAASAPLVVGSCPSRP